MQITQPNIQSPAVSHCRTKASMRLRVRALIGTPPHRTVVERQHSFNTEFVGRLPVGRSSRPSRGGCEHKISIRPTGGGFRRNFSRFFCGIQSACSSSGSRSLGSGVPFERNRAASQTEHRGFAKERSGRGEWIRTTDPSVPNQCAILRIVREIAHPARSIRPT